MSSYDQKPQRLLTQITNDYASSPLLDSYCAGFELKVWRCSQFADHLIEWIPDYALHEDELQVHHGNMYVRLREAAARVYRSDSFTKRGEIGEITLHAICRDFFGTIPLAPRVFYKTASNDVVKSFDLVHVRYVGSDSFELWLGEAKFFTNAKDAIASAVHSINLHISQGFLQNEKLLLGPQISKRLPHYEQIRSLLSVQKSLDDLFSSAVFPVCILCDSPAVAAAVAHCESYKSEVEKELLSLRDSVISSGLQKQIKIHLIYVPLASKAAVALAFHERLKALSP